MLSSECKIITLVGVKWTGINCIDHDSGFVNLLTLAIIVVNISGGKLASIEVVMTHHAVSKAALTPIVTTHTQFIPKRERWGSGMRRM